MRTLFQRIGHRPKQLKLLRSKAAGIALRIEHQKRYAVVMKAVKQRLAGEWRHNVGLHVIVVANGLVYVGLPNVENAVEVMQIASVGGRGVG